MKVVSGLISGTHQPIPPDANTTPPQHASVPASPPASSPPHSFQSESASGRRSPPPAPPASCPPVAEPTETTAHRPDRFVAAPTPSPPATRRSDSHSRASSETSPPDPKA